MRALALLAFLALAGCYITSGPDCGDACSKATACQGLNKTFLLACGANSPYCGTNEAACADCIDQKSCAELIAGACDDVVLDGGVKVPLCLISP